MKAKFLNHSQEEGSAAVEFALLAPILFLFIMGILEFGLLMFASTVIENAATMASRVGLTGNDYASDGGGTDNFGDTAARQARVAAEINKFSFGLLDPAKVHFTPTIHSSYENAGSDKGEGLGNGNEAVTYNVTYDWKFFTPLLGEFFGKGGVYTVTSTVIVKNEDF